MSPTINNSSPALEWLILRKGCSKTRRNLPGTPILSSERNNLAQLHSYKYCGLLSQPTFGVFASPNGGLSISARDSKVSTQTVRKARQSTSLGKHVSSRAAAAKIYKATSAERFDLTPIAIKRAAALLSATRPKKAGRAKKVRGSKAKLVADSDE